MTATGLLLITCIDNPSLSLAVSKYCVAVVQEKIRVMCSKTPSFTSAGHVGRMV